MTEKANLISPFPDVPRQVWKENLLREVICQIRFPKLLVIDRDIPVEFQQSIYRRYPILEEKEVLHFEVQASPSVGSQPLIQNRGREYHFFSKERHWNVSLSSNFIALKTNRYTEWGDFSARIVEILTTFVELYKPATIERIGLRYINIIDQDRLKQHKLDWSSVLKPEFDPLFGSLHDGAKRVRERKSSFQYQLSDNDSSFVTINHGLRSFGEEADASYVIDSDFFQLEEQDTDVNRVNSTLCEFNRSARNLLYWALDQRFVATLE